MFERTRRNFILDKVYFAVVSDIYGGKYHEVENKIYRIQTNDRILNIL